MAPMILPSSPSFTAARGESRHVALADGSRLVVNTASEVRVDFSRTERTVELARGEAFFDVAKDASRPFVVRSGDVLVRAIGTKFSVRRLASGTDVLVAEGRVHVARAASDTAKAPPKPIELASGHRARVPTGGEPVLLSSVDPARATAWTSGKVEFEEATLAEVIGEVNRYTAKEFVLEDPVLGEIRLTGRFHVGDIESVKFALSERFGIAAAEERHRIRLSRPR